MANYLAGLGTSAALNTVGSVAPAISSGGISSGLESALAFGGFSAGTKPRALHTEYATGSANWQRPYGASSDIVFYLVRADSGAPGTSPTTVSGSTPNSPSRDRVISPGTQETLNAQGSLSGATEAMFGASSQTGPDLSNNVQTSLNQVASRTFLDKLTTPPAATPGLAGPLTGLSTVKEVALGAVSQTYAMLGNSTSNIYNALEAVSSLQSLRLSKPSSEKYFHEVLVASFEPTNAKDIMGAFDRGCVSDLAVGLAQASRGVTKTTQLVEGINKGLIGYTCQSSSAEADRLGPKGYSRERLIK